MSKIAKIEICFPCCVELPDGFEQALDALIDMACKKWERENPTMIMWTAGHGAKPIWNDPHEPTFDDSVYQIEIATREDFSGSNPHNPDRERLREAARIRRQAMKTPERFA